MLIVQRVVELDAAVMHGPTHGGGSVASIRNIMHPAAVARLEQDPFPARIDEATSAMLDFLGLSSTEELFGAIPTAIRLAGGLDLPSGISEADPLPCVFVGERVLSGHFRAIP